MSLRRALASLLYLLVVSTFFSAGLFFVSLPYLPDVRLQLEFYLLHSFEIFTLIGFGFLAAAVFFFFGFYALSRGRYLVIKMGGGNAEVNKRLIQLTIEEWLRTHFSKKLSLINLEIIRGHQLEIGVQLHCTHEQKEEEKLLQRVEQEFQTLLGQRFGYTKPFYLVVRGSQTAL